jgi:MinD-like ATPase involved in chromosome partitioning or flagellar assembly
VSVPVLTAVTDARWEERLVEALQRGDLGVTVVRRCVDLADLLASAATGTARAVLVSSDLRRLDRDALSRLAGSGCAVVGLVPAADESAERRLRQLGLLHVLPADSAPDRIAAAVAEAVAAEPAGRSLAAPSDPLAGLAQASSRPASDEVDGGATDDRTAEGRVVAVWGPTGAPGRTTVAVTLAAELAALGTPTMLVDADSYGGAVAQVLGLLDEAPGLAAAARLANQGTLDVPGLAAVARRVSPELCVLTGIVRADRWPELRPAALEMVLALCRRLAVVTVVDCGFCLERDEELVYDQTVARRNAATLVALEQADAVLAVGSADPVSLQRLVRGLADLSEALPGAAVSVVVNRVRTSVVHGNAEGEIRAALARFAGVEPDTFVPLDVAGCDVALREGRTLREVAPASPARLALVALAAQMAGAPAPARPRRRLSHRPRPFH